MPLTPEAGDFDMINSDLICCFFCDISNCLFKPLDVSLTDVPGPELLVVLLVRMTL